MSEKNTCQLKEARH